MNYPRYSLLLLISVPIFWMGVLLVWPPNKSAFAETMDLTPIPAIAEKTLGSEDPNWHLDQATELSYGNMAVFSGTLSFSLVFLNSGTLL